MFLESIVNILAWIKIDIPWALSCLVGYLHDDYNWVLVILYAILAIIFVLGTLAALDVLGIINV